MKIIIAAEIFPPDIGGPATYSSKLADELVERGWDVKLICYSDKKKSFKYKFKVYRITRSKFKRWHYLKYFIQLFILSLNADIIYAQGPVSSGKPATIIKRFFNKKVAVKVVGDYAWEQARNSGYADKGIDEFQNMKLRGNISTLKETQIETCQEADIIITPSVYLKNLVHGWGIPHNKIEVVYNSFGIREPKIKSGKSRDENTLISIGRLVPWKGFETLIHIMPDMLRENSQFKLKIIGDGPDKEKLQNIIHKLGLEKQVTIKSLSHEDTMQELLYSGIFILNSGYEGLSHTILEALSFRAPVITTNVGGNPEVIVNNHNGLLVEYNNKEQLKEAILKLYSNNNQLQKKFAENSKEILKKFTFEKMIKNTISILR